MTAAAVITHGRAAGAEGLVDLADRVGLDTLAELWRTEQPSSLAGALWALYLLRRWTQTNGDEVTRLWRAGRPYAPADEVVAGVADAADPGRDGRTGRCGAARGLPRRFRCRPGTGGGVLPGHRHRPPGHGRAGPGRRA